MLTPCKNPSDASDFLPASVFPRYLWCFPTFLRFGSSYQEQGTVGIQGLTRRKWKWSVNRSLWRSVFEWSEHYSPNHSKTGQLMSGLKCLVTQRPEKVPTIQKPDQNCGFWKVRNKMPPNYLLTTALLFPNSDTSRVRIHPVLIMWRIIHLYLKSDVFGEHLLSREQGLGFTGLNEGL